MALTTSRMTEDFARCECGNCWYEKNKKHLLHKKTMKELETKEEYICVKCGKKITKDEN